LPSILTFLRREREGGKEIDPQACAELLFQSFKERYLVASHAI
jgi:hypothetical protein